MGKTRDVSRVEDIIMVFILASFLGFWFFEIGGF